MDCNCLLYTSTDLYNTHESIISKIRLGDVEGAKQGVVEHLAYACSVELSVWK